MTWETWINSIYNRDNDYYIEDSMNTVKRYSDEHYISFNSSNVRGDENILEKELYDTYYSSTNDDL